MFRETIDLSRKTKKKKKEKAKVTRKLRAVTRLVKLVRGNWQLRLPIEIRSFPFGTEEERGLGARRWSLPKGDSTPSFDSPHGIVPVTGLTARNCSLVWFSHPTPANIRHPRDCHRAKNA